jgi:glycosyltransferase involved in cell wall biosynthesis
MASTRSASRRPGPAREVRSPRAPSGGHPDGPFTIGFLGTLKPWHGLEVLIDAFARLARTNPAHRLLIVGDGPLRVAIETMLAEAGLSDRATFSGAVDPAAVPRWLAQMDVGTAPYAVRGDGLYFSPLKILEYQAAGLPVVASDAGQVRELVRDGVDGWRVEPGDASALAERLEQLRLEPSAARAMGARGREEVVARRSWGAVLDRILAAVPGLDASTIRHGEGSEVMEARHGQVG